jgi:uncharacterized protein (DUF697 family)
MKKTIEATLVEDAASQQSTDQLPAAEALVRKNTYITAGVGILPIPVLDLVALTGIQLNMLYRLSKLYNVPFSREAAKSIIGTLVGGSGAACLAGPTFSLLKAVPLVGSAVGGLTLAVVGGASTYALGKVFIQHFESGGTFLTFDPMAVRAEFAKFQEEGRKVAAEAAAANK